MCAPASHQIGVWRPVLTLIIIASLSLLVAAQASRGVTNANGEQLVVGLDEQASEGTNEGLSDTPEAALRAAPADWGYYLAHLGLRSRSPLNPSAIGDNKFLSRGGLRRLQRRPELADVNAARLRDNATMMITARKRTSHGATNEKQQLIENLSPQAHKFFYVISPVSEQILPFQSERFAQGFRSLLPLPGGNYETGLRKLTPVGVGNGESGPSRGLDWSPESPLERGAALAASEPLGCRATKSRVRLTKDELEPATGRLVYRCSGQVELNACEGSCGSSVEPSVKSASGFTKKCACCNEGSFRRVQVRLSECYLPLDGQQQQQQQQPLLSLPKSYMDIEVEEPIDCKCRQCDSLL